MRTTSSFVLALFVVAPLAGALVACGSKSSSAPAANDVGDDDSGTKLTTTNSEDAGGRVITSTINNDSGTTTTGDDASTSGGDDDASSGEDSSTSHVPPSAHHPANTAPTKNCSTTADSNGFISLMSSQGAYFVHLPPSYDKTKPTPVVIGAHGCGDQAEHFGTWAMDPYNDAANNFASDAQGYIAASVEDVASGCWNIGDGAKIIAALDDLTACYYVDNAHVTIAGYSSGAAAAYSVGLLNAQRFSGILIEDGALYDTGSSEASLLANATWRINIGHMAHNQDGDYPLASVQADWLKIQAAGFPLTELTEDGTHDGTYDDWSEKLMPLITNWSAPD